MKINGNIFEDRLTPSETAAILGIKSETLSVWRCTRRYALPFVKIGKKVFYRGADIQKFIESRTIGVNTDSSGENNLTTWRG
jgi:hypothetical protein